MTRILTLTGLHKSASPFWTFALRNYINSIIPSVSSYQTCDGPRSYRSCKRSEKDQRNDPLRSILLLGQHMYLSTRRATFNHFQGCTLWQLNSCGRSSSSPYQERNRTLPALSHAWPMRGCQIRCPWPWWIATPSLTSDLRPELSVILRCGSQKQERE